MSWPLDQLQEKDAEIARLKETNNRLNRRCQLAESAVMEKVATSKTGQSFGRMLANGSASIYKRRLDEVRHWWPIVKEMIEDASHLRDPWHEAYEHIEEALAEEFTEVSDEKRDADGT